MVGLNEFDYLAGQAAESSQSSDPGTPSATEEPASTGGQIPVWDGAAYVPGTVEGEAGGITVAFDAGSRTLTIQLPQALGSAATPTFAGLTIGATGTEIALVKQRTYTIDFGSVSANSVLDSVQTFTGVVPATTGVLVSAPDGVIAGNALGFDVWVSDADEITIRAINPTAGAIDPGSGDFLVVAFVF